MRPAPCILEPLEGRALLDSAFASVGFLFESEAFGEILTTVYASEGRLDDAGAAAGDTFIASGQDRYRAGDLPYDAVHNLGDGRALRSPDRGILGRPEESNGARFLSGEGYPAGWWFADFGEGDKAVEYIVERPENASARDFEGTWRFSLIGAETDDDDFYNGHGRIVIDDGEIEWFENGGRVPPLFSRVVSVSADGRLLTDASEYFYLSRDGSVLVFADMAEDDEEIFIGVAVRDNARPAEAELVGDYLLAWAFADVPAFGGPNGEVDYRQRALRLEPDGDYRIWDLDDFDSGRDDDEDAISRGFWRISGDTLILDGRNSDDVLVFAISENGSTLVPLEFDDGDFVDPIAGIATRVVAGDGPPPPGPGTVLAVPAVGEFGRPVVYQLGTDEVWEVVDLIREAGGPDITGGVVSWIDPKDGRAYAAGVGGSGVILYSEPANGDWTFRDLTGEIAGAEGIAPGAGVRVMIAPDGLATLTGLNSEGELVRYTQTGASAAAGFVWEFSNVEEDDLAPAGEETPGFVGDLVSFATPWGALNVAGLDGAGRIQSVWWAPGRSRWTVTDLTEASGAAPLAGDLTVYLTPWNGINLAGLDSAGRLQVTWWVPEFRGAWARTDLTAETDGPLFTPGSVTSFVSGWGGLNVAGIEEETGEVKAYWWTPERTAIGWAVTSLSEEIPAGSARIVGDELEGATGADGSLNVFGYDGAGEGASFVRYFWEPGFGGGWRAQDLTEIAVDR